MEKTSPNPIPRFLIIAICSLLMLPACQEDDKEISPSEIQFTLNLQNVTEGDEATILLTLDKPAPGNGSVELTIETNAIYKQHYLTDPALIYNSSIVLNISKGQKSAELKITTIDNAKYEGTRFIIFQLKSPSTVLRLGATTTLTLTIGDDEGPSLANFPLNAATLNEKEENGIVVQIPFSAPAKGEGSVTVTLNAGQAVNKTNFTIDQELNNSSFSFNVLPNATSVSFKLFPVDNDLFTGNFILSFSITEISGVVQKGNSLKYSLTLVDDEAPSIAKFALPSGTVAETNADGIIVEILLSSPVKGEGGIVITLPPGNAVYGTDFTTLPEVKDNTITLSLSHDQTSASFTVFPVNNDLLKENLIRSFSISEASGVVWKGSNDLSYELTFVDDEGPSIANFAVSSATIDEINSAGMEVEIQFSNPAAGTGKIIVEVLEYDFNFTSDPEGEKTYYDRAGYFDRYTYHITLDVAQYAESVSFKIFPLDNSKSRRCNEAGLTTFTIATVSGVIRKGDNQTFDLTVKYDEPLIVTLNEKEGSLNEKDTAGKEILFNFSKPSMKDGSIFVFADVYEVQSEGGGVGYHPLYTTVPGMYYEAYYADMTSLNYQKDDKSVLFKVLPINDSVKYDNFTVTFSIAPSLSGFNPSPYDGCVKIQDDTYTLTIDDDD